MRDPVILILAAGSSSRMRGADKLTQSIDGEAQLSRIARAALATDLDVIVALPPDRPARDAAIKGLHVHRVTVPDPGLGMAESLKCGLAALPPDAPLILLLADLPDIDSDDLVHMHHQWLHHPDAILRACDADGMPGHPVCFPADLRGELMALSGDEGAKTILDRHKSRLHLIPLPGHHATTDLDTPEDWAAWRAKR
jgi:molybdenum cofactor cytidylyltransferase